ncbi:hypothetical protein NSA24_04145 [Clostridioides mangenotii]|nr:hypothetical protein [Clostridioides mangenotii]MCR1954027.1 hypothetical protein [Clostridioides mangenotii]
MKLQEYIRNCMRHKKLPTLKFNNYCSREFAKGKKTRLLEWRV